MANPQKENGHLDIANELVEKFARLNLPAYEWRVLWAVLRKTYSWKKKSDRVAVSQLVELTGLRKQHASRAKLSLIRKQLLIEQDGKIGLNKNYETWLVNGFVVTSKGDETVTNTGYSVTSTGDTKVTNSGEIVTSIGDKSSPVQEPQKKRKKLTKENTAHSLSGSSPRKRRETATDYEPSPAFVEFWGHVHFSKGDRFPAWQQWQRLDIERKELVERVTSAIKAAVPEWQQREPKYRPRVAKWLGDGNWMNNGQDDDGFQDPTPEQAEEIMKKIMERRSA